MIARSLDIRALARALAGDVVSRNSILAPGPGHSRKDRSLSVTFDGNAAEGFVVHSFAGDDPLVCRDHVRGLAGLPPWTPGSNSSSRPSVFFRPEPGPGPLPRFDEEDARIEAKRRARATAVWEAASDPRETIVEAYLASRALTLPEEVANTVIRFHPACPWKDDSGYVLRVPAMICAMRNIESDEITAVHRRRLSQDGQKVGKPRMLGIASGAVIKIDAHETVTSGLIVGEGVETALSARQLGFRPVWALGSVSTIATFPVLAGIAVLSILAESDDNGANARAITECASRWQDAGRAVLAIESRVGGDINDAIARWVQ